MRTLLLILISVFLLLGCRLILSADKTELFIPGTYVRHSSHEFGKEYDTLIISVQNESAHEFKILRRWRYERVLDGKDIEPQYKQITTTAIYHCVDKLMQDVQSGTLYSFDVERKLLYNGEVKYNKQ